MSTSEPSSNTTPWRAGDCGHVGTNAGRCECGAPPPAAPQTTNPDEGTTTFSDARARDLLAKERMLLRVRDICQEYEDSGCQNSPGKAMDEIRDALGMRDE